MKALLTVAIASLFLFILISGFRKEEITVNAVDVGVVVSDLEKSLTFYTRVLGMEQTGTWHSSKEMSTAYGVNSGKAFDIIDLKLPCKGYVLKYKLNNTPGKKAKDGTLYGNSESYGFEEPGTRYLTINVKDVNQFIVRIKENNIKFKLVILPTGRRIILVRDPDGALLEIASN
jgi:catechol 2,3-dioxygenase-like lactoylglutathione lyase family enzyme